MTAMSVDAGRHGPFQGRLDPESIAAYAAATGDRTRSVMTGQAVPAVFPVIPVRTAQLAANEDLPVRTVRAGTQVVVHIRQLDADGRIAVLGSPPTDHRFPESACDNRIGSATHHIDHQIARRYAEVSGDWAAHHFDIAAARTSGFEFVFTHGLCTMAICAHRVLGLIGVDDPGRVARVAVRSTSPTPLGADLSIDAYGIDERSFAFEATSRSVKTVSHGRSELR